MAGNRSSSDRGGKADEGGERPEQKGAAVGGPTMRSDPGNREGGAEDREGTQAATKGGKTNKKGGS